MNAATLHVLVLTEFRKGFGVEDIARRHSLSIDEVRQAHTDLRAQGVIRNIRWSRDCAHV